MRRRNRRFLAPLDDLLAKQELEDFTPQLLDLARIHGGLFSLPRNVDVRLLHYRTDLIAQPPATWDDLLDLARALNRPPHQYGFVFPGMESGLFGTFYELVEMGGAELFPPNLVPQIENDGGRWALSLLRTFYAEGLVPPAIVEWHYDKVHDCFRDGHAAMVGDWPGYYADYCDPQASAVHDRFALARYPVGPIGKSLVYGGSHTFALTRQGAAIVRGAGTATLPDGPRAAVGRGAARVGAGAHVRHAPCPGTGSTGRPRRVGTPWRTPSVAWSFHLSSGATLR